jgi:Tol biopolymer transport system component
MGFNADKGGWQLIIVDLSSSRIAASFVPTSGNYTGYVSWNIWNDQFVFNDQIVGDKDYDIMLAGFSGSARDITPDQMDSGETIQRAIYPAFSPDGSKVVFTCFGSERVYRLCVSEVGAYKATVIYRDIGPKEEYPLGSPVWSADGAWIYFSAKDGDDWDIFRIKPTGGGIQNLTSSWSSDEITPSVP